MNIVNALEKDIERNHLSKHPFYTLWNEGRLSREALEAYAQQYYVFVSEFPRFVSRVHSNTPDAEDRQLILENLNEEENPKQPHDKLWRDFAEGIGVKRIGASLLPETKKSLRTFQQLSSASCLEGAASLLAYESQISEIAELKAAGLKKYYGVKDKKTLKFFEVHGKVDIEHQKTWKTIIAKHAKTKEDQSKVRSALIKSLKAMWLLLDGVYREYC